VSRRTARPGRADDHEIEGASARRQDFVERAADEPADDMSDLYSTVPQREIQAAVGAVISLAKYRELLQDGASWWESGGKGPANDTGHPAVAR
jgi:hypothetical protein